MQPPHFRLLACSAWKRASAAVAVAFFAYSVWQLVVLKKEDRVAALLLVISFLVIFGLSISDAFRRRRELLEWSQKEPIQQLETTRWK